MIEDTPITANIEPFAVRIPVAAKLLGLGRSKIYELIGTSSIEIVKEGRATLIVVASLRQYIEDRRSGRLS